MNVTRHWHHWHRLQILQRHKRHRRKITYKGIKSAVQFWNTARLFLLLMFQNKVFSRQSVYIPLCFQMQILPCRQIPRLTLKYSNTVKLCLFLQGADVSRSQIHHWFSWQGYRTSNCRAGRLCSVSLQHLWIPDSVRDRQWIFC